MWDGNDGPGQSKTFWQIKLIPFKHNSNEIPITPKNHMRNSTLGTQTVYLILQVLFIAVSFTASELLCHDKIYFSSCNDDINSLQMLLCLLVVTSSHQSRFIRKIMSSELGPFVQKLSYHEFTGQCGCFASGFLESCCASIVPPSKEASHNYGRNV